MARMGPPWTVWPPLRALGRIAAEDVRGAWRGGWERRWPRSARPPASAATSRPIMDVDTNPKNPIIGDRSFGDDPELVGRLGRGDDRGPAGRRRRRLRQALPGARRHRASTPTSTCRWSSTVASRLEDVELRPFRRAIEAGVATIMMAHVLFRELDPELPASLSPADRRRHPAPRARLRGRRAHGRPRDEGGGRPLDAGPTRRCSPCRPGCDILPVCITHDAQVAAMEGADPRGRGGEVPYKAMDDALRADPRA